MKGILRLWVSLEVFFFCLELESVLLTWSLKLMNHLFLPHVLCVFLLCVSPRLHLSVCKCVHMGVRVRVLFSCVHSTGQKTEFTATVPSRWSLSLLTWRRTSSAEYFGSTTRLGYGHAYQAAIIWEGRPAVFLLSCSFLFKVLQLICHPSADLNSQFLSVTVHLTLATHKPVSVQAVQR